MKSKWSIILLTVAIIILAFTSYFMFTTTLSSPAKMELYMPKDEGEQKSKYADVRSRLTLVLLEDNKVFGYYGDFISGGRIVSTDQTDTLIEDGWKMFSKDSLVVIIKPTKAAAHKATVDILDKMTINQINKFEMMEPGKEEKDFLKIDE